MLFRLHGQKLNDLLAAVHHKLVLKAVLGEDRNAVAHDTERVALLNEQDIALVDSRFSGADVETVGLKRHAGFVKEQLAANDLRAAEVVCRDAGAEQVSHFFLNLLYNGFRWNEHTKTPSQSGGCFVNCWNRRKNLRVLRRIFKREKTLSAVKSSGWILHRIIVENSSFVDELSTIQPCNA